MVPQFHSGIGRSPFEATFGCKARLGLCDSKLPPSVARALHTEEELKDALDQLAETSAEVQDGAHGSQLTSAPSTDDDDPQAGPSSAPCEVCEAPVTGGETCSVCSRPVHPTPACSSQDDSLVITCTRQVRQAYEYLWKLTYL